jgi:hypothetical protein
MPLYAKIEISQIQEYPLTEYDIKARFKNVSWVIGEFNPPQDYVAVTAVSKPTYNTITENCVEDTPVFTTEWTQVWSVQPASPEEILARTDSLAALVRTERNNKLSASDWTQLPDVTIFTKTDWAIYRQALRDVTAQPGFPITMTWPQEP